MKQLTIIGIWLALLIVDGIILPSLTGLPSGFGIIVFLSALVITFGVHRWVISLGIVLSCATEIILGNYFGVIIGSWVVMAWGWYVLNQSLNLKPLSENESLLSIAPFTFLGLGLVILGEGSLWAISHFVYQPSLTTSILFAIITSSTLVVTILIELFTTLALFHLFYRSEESIYG